jgi:hypothetical protein
MLLVPPLTLYTRWWWDAIAVVRGFPSCFEHHVPI